jgi:hypothetical protein
MSRLATPPAPASEHLPLQPPSLEPFDRYLAPDELERLVVSVGHRQELWLPHVDSEDAPFTVLVADERLELLLFRWAGGRATDVHGHDRSSGAFYVCRGSVVEDRFERRQRLGRAGSVLRHAGRRTLSAGASGSFSPPYFHAVRHLAGTPPAYSIHAYSPPFERRADT